VGSSCRGPESSSRKHLQESTSFEEFLIDKVCNGSRGPAGGTTLLFALAMILWLS